MYVIRDYAQVLHRSRRNNRNRTNNRSRHQSPPLLRPLQPPPRLAIAAPNAATRAIGIVITEPPGQCGPLQPFPPSCEPVWRIRIDIMPEQQQPGQYALGPAYRCLPTGTLRVKPAVPGEPARTCKNLGSDVVGTLTIVAIDAAGISGVLSGAGEADGPFRAERCPACGGTGQACTGNAECCNDYCYEGRCQA